MKLRDLAAALATCVLLFAAHSARAGGFSPGSPDGWIGFDPKTGGWEFTPGYGNRPGGPRPIVPIEPEPAPVRPASVRASEAIFDGAGPGKSMGSPGAVDSAIDEAVHPTRRDPDGKASGGSFRSPEI